MDLDELEQSIDADLNGQDFQTPSDILSNNGTNKPCEMECIEPIVEITELSCNKQIVNQGSALKTKNSDEFGILRKRKSYAVDPCFSFMNMAIIYFESQGFLIEASILKEVIDYENPIKITERLKNLLEQNITDEKETCQTLEGK